MPQFHFLAMRRLKVANALRSATVQWRSRAIAPAYRMFVTVPGEGATAASSLTNTDSTTPVTTTTSSPTPLDSNTQRALKWEARKSLIADIGALHTPKDIKTFFRKTRNEFDTFTHIALLNQLTRLDPHASYRIEGEPSMHHLEYFLYPDLSVLRAIDIANIWYCFGHYNRSMRPRFIRTANKHLTMHAETAAKTGNGTALWTPSASCLAATAFHPVVSGLGPEEEYLTVPNSAWALAKGGVRAAPIYRSLEAEAVPVLQQFDPEALLKLVWAFAHVAYQPAQLMEQLNQQVAEQWHNFTYPQSVLMAWSLAALGSADTSLITSVFEGLSPEAIAALAPATQQQLYQTHFLLRKRNPRVPLPPLPEEIENTVKEIAANAAKRQRTTPIVNNVSRHLWQIGVPHVRHASVEGYIVPIAFPPTKVVLEVDAPPELAAEDQEEAQELTSQQEARAAHLTSLGYQVLRLNYYPWRRQSELNRKSHLRDLTLGLRRLMRQGRNAKQQSSSESSEANAALHPQVRQGLERPER